MNIGKPAPGKLRHYQVQEWETDKETWNQVKTRNQNIKINKLGEI
jgi:hypothetical protein